MTDQLQTRDTRLTQTDRVAVHAVPALLMAVGTYMVTDEESMRAFGAGQLGSSTTPFRKVAGLRTAWLGLALLTLHRAGQHRALGGLLLIMAPNPATDLALAVSTGGGRRALIHLPGILTTSICGARLLRPASAHLLRPGHRGSD